MSLSSTDVARSRRLGLSGRRSRSRKPWRRSLPMRWCCNRRRRIRRRFSVSNRSRAPSFGDASACGLEIGMSMLDDTNNPLHGWARWQAAGGRNKSLRQDWCHRSTGGSVNDGDNSNSTHATLTHDVYTDDWRGPPVRAMEKYTWAPVDRYSALTCM